MTSETFLNNQVCYAETLEFIKLGNGRVYVVDIVFSVNRFGTARFVITRDNSNSINCKKIYNTCDDNDLSFYYDSSYNFYVRPSSGVGLRVVSVYSSTGIVNTKQTSTSGMTKIEIA